MVKCQPNKSVEYARLPGGPDACSAGEAHFNRYAVFSQL